jgi:hypothetical protein
VLPPESLESLILTAEALTLLLVTEFTLVSQTVLSTVNWEDFWVLAPRQLKVILN